MRYSSLKNLSFGLALISFLAAGAASAQSLAGVTTRLDQTLDSRTAKVGEAVSVKLNDTVKTPDGVKLPRGTQLLGKVAEVKTAANSGPASVTLVFTSAKLKDGKEIQVKATLVGAYTSSEGGDSTYGSQTMAPAPALVNADDTFDQQAGALHRVSLTSAVKNSDSGTFTSKDGNFKLQAGTYLQLGIAGAGNSGLTRTAE
ncbi:MAG TPA: hypothetical protein VHX37_18340 [Acidobacteriaceae bacterium]|jgi:hypothetical protein|nr:hypothetical protein [Acidobacteriaceae bacterium]